MSSESDLVKRGGGEQSYAGTPRPTSNQAPTRLPPLASSCLHARRPAAPRVATLQPSFRQNEDDGNEQTTTEGEGKHEGRQEKCETDDEGPSRTTVGLERRQQIHPILEIKREQGGWLAVAARGAWLEG